MARAKGIDWDNEPGLGVESDMDLAAKHDVWPGTVGRVRKARGLPAPVKPPRLNFTADELRKPTKQIMRERRCSRSPITKARKRLGVTDYVRAPRPIYRPQVTPCVAAAVRAVESIVRGERTTVKHACYRVAADMRMPWKSVAGGYYRAKRREREERERGTR